MQQISLSGIIDKWIAAVHDDKDINEFCQAKYNKLPVIQKGWDERDAPTEDDCPYIAFHAAHKEEGGQPGIYEISVLWAVKNDHVTIADRIRSYDGTSECDRLGELIVRCVNAVNPSYPLETVEFDEENENFYPGFPGHAVLTLHIPVRMGVSINY
jgi:hypothetical protein